MYYAITAALMGLLVVLIIKRKKQNKNDWQQTKRMENKEEEFPIKSQEEHVIVEPYDEKGYMVKDGVKKEVTIKHMPQGLQVFDENGTCVVDVTSRITKYLGELIIPTTDGSYYDARLKDGDFWFLITDLINPNVFEQWDGSESKFFPKINAKDGLITWEYPVNMKYRPGVKIIYGIY